MFGFGLWIEEELIEGAFPQSHHFLSYGEELLLFSGTPIPAQERPFVPEDQSMKQAQLPRMPAVDEDVMVTREIVQAGQLLDVEVLDHLVIGAERWVSLREKRLGWDR